MSEWLVVSAGNPSSETQRESVPETQRETEVKTLVVPESTPIVTFKSGDRDLLVPGAKILVTAQIRDGKPTALRALAGRDGFAPPM